METSRSPRRVLRAAHRLGQRVLPDHAGKFARHDFTLAQLFACLVLREFYGLSYRRAEHLLRDSPQWLADIGLSAAPDHNTLWRAFGVILNTRRVNRMLYLLAARFARAKLLRLGDKPLALYVFGEENADKVLTETSSGGACVNDAMVHIGVNALPFGGVGESGYGAYHGRWGFETFSHRKAVLRRPGWFADSPVLRPPYSRWKQAVVRKLF